MAGGIGSKLEKLGKSIFYSKRRRSKFLRRLVHDMGPGLPRCEAEFVPEISSTAQDEAIVERALKAYRRAVETAPARDGRKDDLWTILGHLQRHYFDLLESGDVKGLAAYLCNMARMDATIGMVQGPREFERIRQDKEYRLTRPVLIKDKLVAFAEAVGVLACETPEQGSWGANLHKDADDILALLETRMGIGLAPPDIDGALFKLVCRHGRFHDRDLYAQYTAWLIREIAGEGSRVIEIGGGTGRLAYWLWKLGAARTTIVDLPHVGVLQAYYLLKSTPEGTVSLFGEAASGAIELVPNHAAEGIGDDACDLVVNQDSLPEIGRAAAENYIEWIKKVSARWFLSINQEAATEYGKGQVHNRVADLVFASGEYRRVIRAPYWLRRGYVTELYDVAAGGAEEGSAADH